jgi:glyoxylase I family protein
MSMAKDKRIKLRGMAPLLQVYDMQESVDFYCEKLDFDLKEVSESFDWVWLSFNDCDVMLNTLYDVGERPATHDVDRERGHADTCLYFGCPDVEDAYRVLVDRGLSIDAPSITKYNYKAIYIQDPDGYMLCFHWPMPGGAK